MANYSEQDPLLPKDKQAPEIQGSRPSSIQGIEDEEAASKRFSEPAKGTSSGIVALLVGTCVLLLFSVLVFPESFGRTLPDDQKPLPKTLEQRVSRILANTPLIGNWPLPSQHANTANAS